jgi:hypothetical protein
LNSAGLAASVTTQKVDLTSKSSGSGSYNFKTKDFCSLVFVRVPVSEFVLYSENVSVSTPQVAINLLSPSPKCR